MNEAILSKRVTVKKFQIYLIKGASHKIIFLIGSDRIFVLDWKLLAGSSVPGVSVRTDSGLSFPSCSFIEAECSTSWVRSDELEDAT